MDAALVTVYFNAECVEFSPLKLKDLSSKLNSESISV